MSVLAYSPAPTRRRKRLLIVLLADPAYRQPNAPYAPFGIPAKHRPPALYFPSVFAPFSPPRTHGVAFLHARRTPDGGERLVAVQLEIFDVVEIGPALAIRVQTYRPATWRPGTKLTYIRNTGIHGLRLFPSDNLRLYAGQADPADPTHFTMAYEYRDGRGTIDVWLREPKPPLRTG